MTHQEQPDDVGEWAMVPRVPTEAMLHEAQAVAIAVYANEDCQEWTSTSPHEARDIWSAMLAASPAPLKSERVEVERYRHKKRGTEYEVIGTAELQAELPQCEHAALVIYRGDDGKLWARNSGEFHDGRFERLEAASTFHTGEGK